MTPQPMRSVRSICVSAHHWQDDGNRFEGSEALSAYLTERDVTHTTYFTDGTHHGVTEDVIADMRAYVELFI